MTTDHGEMAADSELSSRSMDISKMLTKCEELVAQFQYDLAIKFCDRILSLEPTQLDALHLKATILIDMGDGEAAKPVLRLAVATEPHKGPEKYIALAQLSEGEEAVGHFIKALDILRASPPTAGPTEEEEEEEEEEGEKDVWRRQVAAVYCSLAELYMTDLCLQPEAESRCEEYVQAALDISPEDYEAYQTMASMRMSQSRVEEAAEAMGRSLELWTAIPFEHPEYPSYEFRLVAARLLIEMGSMDVAQSILESLSVEDDEILEVWYLLALALYSLEKRPAANEALLHAEKLASLECPPEIADAIAELREALGEAVQYEGDELDDTEEPEDQGMHVDEGEPMEEHSLD